MHGIIIATPGDAGRSSEQAGFSGARPQVALDQSASAARGTMNTRACSALRSRDEVIGVNSRGLGIDRVRRSRS